MASFELDQQSTSDGAVAPFGAIEHLDAVEVVGAGLPSRGIDLPTHVFALEGLSAKMLSWQLPGPLMLLTKLW